MPLEPGRLSTMTDCLNASFKPCATRRAVISVDAPGDCGTMIRTGREGYGCAITPLAASNKAIASTVLIGSPPSLVTRHSSLAASDGNAASIHHHRVGRPNASAVAPASGHLLHAPAVT